MSDPITTEQSDPITTEQLNYGLATTGKPATGGCVYIDFTKALELPTDASTPLPSGWTSLGEVSENGWTLVRNVTSNDFKGWHGETMLSEVSDEGYQVQFAFVEVSRPAVAKLFNGKDNVTDGSDGTVSKIVAKSGAITEYPVVIEELESSGAKKRTVFPRLKPQSFDNEAHRQGELLVRGGTFSALSDQEYGFWQEFRAVSNG